MKLETKKLAFLYNFIKLKIVFYHITPFCIYAIKFATGIQNGTGKTEQN